MRRYFTPINLTFFFAIATTVLIVFGIIPRTAAFFVLIAYALYMLFYSLEEGVNLFLRSIPFFIALPLTESFDNFNMWRILLLMLFIRWALENSRWKALQVFTNRDRFKAFVRKNKIEATGLLFLFVAGLSMLVGQGAQLSLDMGFSSARRFIFVLNAVFMFIILRSLIMEDKSRLLMFAKNFSYSAVLAIFFGYVQFIAAYFQPAWVFHYWWGRVISTGMYGSEWSDIVTNFGNTWFSYSGETLRLRMFSLFPDTHSFPMYVIMALPALFILLAEKVRGLKKLATERAFKVADFMKSENSWRVLGFLAIVNLALILTGTRGIWLSSICVLAVVFLFRIYNIERRFNVFILGTLVIFFLMVPVYFGIATFPQFQDTDFTASASSERIRSVIDFGETSNKLRLYIWSETIDSIKKHPLLGVGIGNYPQVLTEPISAAQAGSSAHNLYLHIASTIGIPGLIVFFWFVWKIVIEAIRYIKDNEYTLPALYMALMLSSLAWIGGYSMTDAALYDERALLAFMAMLGIGIGLMREFSEGQTDK